MEEYEEEEERAVVMIELQGVFDPNVLLKGTPPMKIVGIDSGEPILQIGNCTFSGTYEDTLGTTLFFDKPLSGDSEKCPCVFKTDKKLTMKRVFLQKKNDISEQTSEMDISSNEQSQLPSASEVLVKEDNSEEVNSLALQPPASITSVPAMKDSELLKILVSSAVGNTDSQKSSSENKSSEQGSNIMKSPEKVPKKPLTDSDKSSKVLDEVAFTSPLHAISKHSKEPESLVSNETRNSDLSEVETDKSSEFDDLIIISELEESNEATGEHSPSDGIHTFLSNDKHVGGKLPSLQIDNNKEVSDKGASAITESPVTDVLDFLLSEIHNVESNILRRPIENGHLDDIPAASFEYHHELCQSSSNGTPAIYEQQVLSSGHINHNNEEDSEEMDVEPSQISYENSVNTLHNDVNITSHISSHTNSAGAGSSNGPAVISENTGFEMGSAVNSTVSDSTEIVNRSSLSLVSFNIQGNEAKSCTSLNYGDENNVVRTVKDSVDSTSNQIFQQNERPVSYKSNSGIDSTTNESGDKLVIAPVGSPSNLAIASSSSSGVDSTLGNLSVDFEMREARNLALDENISIGPNVLAIDVNHSIDSTSNVITRTNQAIHSNDNHNISESISASSSPFMEIVQNNQPGEASASCSESSSGVGISNSEQDEGNAMSLDGGCIYQDTSSCNVTESHMDENQGVQSPLVDENFAIRSPSFSSEQDENNIISESRTNDVQDDASLIIVNSASNEVSESCSSSENQGTFIEHEHGYFPEGLSRSSQSHGRYVDSSSNSRVEESSLDTQFEISMQISDSSACISLERRHASTSEHENQRSEQTAGSLQHVTASSDCNSIVRVQPDSPGANDDCVSEALESNREAAVCAVPCNADVVASHAAESNSGIESQSSERISLRRGDDEVSESLVYYRSTRSNMSTEELCSEADALDAVSDSQDACESFFVTNDQSFCEVSESDENIIYVMTSREANENEVTESSASTIAGRSHLSIVNDLISEDEAMDFILASSEQDEMIGHGPCVSSNEQSQSTTASGNISSLNGDSREIVDTQGPDSRPSSSSKEVLDSNAGTLIYDIQSSPETERFNDPCSSSSNKFLLKNDSASENNPSVRDYYDSENLGCCSTSDAHQISKSYNRNAQELAEGLHHNEAEVTESCIEQDSRLAWDASESNTDEEGTLYIVTDSPGAEVSESCATSSDQHRNTQSSTRYNTFEASSAHSAEITESVVRQSTFEATESNIVFKTTDSESSSDSEELDLSLARISSARDPVSNSSDIFLSSQANIDISEEPDDSSSCEVTESCIKPGGSSEISPNKQVSNFPKHVSPSSSDAASTSQAVMSSRPWRNISSTASNRPPVSGFNVPLVTGSSSNAVVVSSANEISQRYGHQESESLSTASTSSATASQSTMLNNTLRTATNQVSDSNAENPADSTNDRNTSNRNRYMEQRPDGSDSVKFPSSTSN